MSKFVVGISHKPSDPKRVARLKDILGALRMNTWRHVEDVPGPTHIWSQRMWHATLKLAKQHQATHCMFLQDDIILCPDFMSVCENMVDARPNDVVCLHTNHWMFEDLYKKGHSWGQTFDGLVGNAYWLPVKLLEEFLVFRDYHMRTETVVRYNEDAQINLWAMATKRTILHPIPSPIDHDTDIDSTWLPPEKVQKHLYRRPVVHLDDSNSAYWLSTATPAPPFLVYEQEHWRLRTHLKQDAVDQFATIERMYELDRYKLPRERP